MPADTVTPIRASLKHLDSCDREVYGRAVMFFIETCSASDITAESIRNYVRGFREQQSCGCLAWRTRTAQADLRRAKLAWTHSTTDANADRVADAEAELARLRGMA